MHIEITKDAITLWDKLGCGSNFLFVETSSEEEDEESDEREEEGFVDGMVGRVLSERRSRS